jgi:hypothetical protein
MMMGDGERTERGKGGADSSADGGYGGQGPREGDDEEAPEGNSGGGREGAVGGSGCVYFIETHDGAFVKIGYSARVHGRMREIGFRGHRTLRLVGWMPGTMETEKWLHHKFAEDCDHLEWFRNSIAIQAFMAAVGLIKPPHSLDTIGEKDAGAVAMALKRAASMTPERRKEIAQKAIETRWKNAKKKKAGKTEA